MANVVIRRMFNRFERPCPLWEISQLDWNLSLVLRSSIHLPYELLKLSSDKHLTWKAWFSLVVTSAKRVSKFVTRKVGGLVPSFLICGQRPRTPLYDPRFEGFAVPNWADYGQGQRQDLVMPHQCPQEVFQQDRVAQTCLLHFLPFGGNGCLWTPYHFALDW